MAAALSATGDYGTPTLEQSYVFSIYAGSGSDDVNPTVLLGQHTLTIGDNTETPLQKDKPIIFKREGNVLKLVHKNANNGQDVEYVMNAGLESTLADVTKVYITMRSAFGYVYYDATPLIFIP